MKRRKFVNKIGGITAGLAVYPGMPLSVWGNETGGTFSDEELKAALEKYCRKIFYSKPDMKFLTPNGRYFFADSFEVEADSNTNSIFDFADQVIEKTKSSGFDASALKEGKMPKGMTVANGGVMIQNEKFMTIFKVEGLKNYNATIIYRKCINISTKVAPSEWKKLKKVEVSEKEKMITISGNLKGIFRIWISNDRHYSVNIEEIEPAVRFPKDASPITTVKDDFLKEVFSQEIQDIIFKDRT